MPLTTTQRQQLRKRCELIVPGWAHLSPAEEFSELAQWCAANNIEHDQYGQGELVQAFEQKIAGLLGLPAAVFMPSGVMAQLAALRIWTEAAHLPRFGLHATSHLMLHEQEAYAALMHCHAVVLGERLRPLLAADLQASLQPMACVMVELPLREAGGLLPSWDELAALKAAAHERGLRLHMDGARLWESRPFYGRSAAEVVAGFDSVYVSVYKGIGALSGALLAGDEAFVAQPRLWRRRMGGTLYHLSPMVASAAMRFDERLAQMPVLHQRALDLAQGLATLPGLRANPRVPHTNMLHLYLNAPVDLASDARDRLADATGCWLLDGLRPAEVPGWCFCELTVGGRLLNIGNERVIPLFQQLAKALVSTVPDQTTDIDGRHRQ